MKFQKSIIISTSAAKIFKKYTEVTSWKNWDCDVKESTLLGGFSLGNVGTLVPITGPKVKFKITEVTLNESFSTQTKLPLCTMEFSHVLECLGGATRVTHCVSFVGLTSFIFSRLIGNPIKKSLPETLNGLKKACE